MQSSNSAELLLNRDDDEKEKTHKMIKNYLSSDTDDNTHHKKNNDVRTQAVDDHQQQQQQQQQQHNHRDRINHNYSLVSESSLNLNLERDENLSENFNDQFDLQNEKHAKNERTVIEKAQIIVKERLRFYMSIFLSVVSMSAGSSLLFLMPLYVDPAISTLHGNFVQKPVQCTTIAKKEHIGLVNCTWSSCREGCTSDMYQCVHIYVSYKHPNQSVNLQDNALFLVNMNGCGYPPSIQCKNFTDSYGIEGAQFPCFYSQINRTIVLSHYNRDEQISIIIKYFLIPFIVTCISAGALCFMHCDWSIYCGRKKFSSKLPTSPDSFSTSRLSVLP